MPGGLHIPRLQTSAEVDALFASQRRGDPIGYRVHLWLTLAACTMLCGPTMAVELAWAPALICLVVRMTGQHPILEPLAFDRVIWVTLAAWAWAGVSIAWTKGTSATWLQDVQGARFLPAMLIVWCVLDRRSWIIAAILAGSLVGLLAQWLHLIDASTGGALGLPIQRAPGRISGWMDPVSGGSVLVAMLGLWLAPALWGRGWGVRAIGGLGSALTLVGIGLTGTRGAWIAAAGVLPIAAALALWQVRPRRRVLAPIGVAMAAGLIGVGVAWASAGEHVRARLEAARNDVRMAMSDRNYASDTGMRLAMWSWALAAGKEHPVLGLGGGGYQPWVRSRGPEEARALGAPADAAPMVHAHAHSWYLHALATLGVPGLLLTLGMLGAGTWYGLIGTPGGGGQGGWASALEAGPALALIGLGLAGMFDAIAINQQTAILLCVLLGLCAQRRPRGTGAAT